MWDSHGRERITMLHDVTKTSEQEDAIGFLDRMARTPTDRRQFLRWAGVSILVAAVAGCSKDNPVSPAVGVNLGTGDTAVLNYAYALEQLEAAFYTQVVATPYSGISAAELQMMTEIRDHEVIHRNFFKSALGASAIADLSVTFASVNFTSRASVLATAKTFEDLGVSAYNGAGQLLASAVYLTLAGKIVSVEARHASAIRDLLAPKTASFAGDDVVNVTTGLDAVRSPSQVLALADPFVVTPINRGDLP